MEQILGNLIKNTSLLDQYELNRNQFPTILDRYTFDCISMQKEAGNKKVSLIDISKYLEEYTSSSDVTPDQVQEYIKNLKAYPLIANEDKFEAEYTQLINNATLHALKKLGLNTAPFELSLDNINLKEMQEYYVNEINQIFEKTNINRQIKICTPSQLPNADKELKPLIDSLLLEETFNSIVAPAKAGKSQFGYQMAYCLQNGVDFLNKHVNQCDVLYVDYELRPNAIKKRFTLLDEFLNAPEHKEYNVISATSEMKLDDIIHAIIDYKKSNPNLKAVFFDCFYRFTEGDRNKEEDQIGTLAKIKSLTEYGLAVIYIHHTNKTSTVAYGNRKQDRINNAIYAAGGSGVHGKIVDETYVIVPNADSTGIIVNTGRDWTNDIICYRKDDSTNWFFQYDATENSETSKTNRRIGILTPEKVKEESPEIWEFLGEDGKNTRTILKNFTSETKVTLKEKGFRFDSKKDKFYRPLVKNKEEN